MKLTRNEIEIILKDQGVKTKKGFYIIPVYDSESNSTIINNQQFWGLSSLDIHRFTTELKQFFFFRNMKDIKLINEITTI